MDECSDEHMSIERLQRTRCIAFERNQMRWARVDTKHYWKPNHNNLVPVPSISWMMQTGIA